MSLFISPRIMRLIELAIDEDEVDFDVTSRAFFGASERRVASLVAKAELRVCGHDVARAVFHRLDPSIEYRVAINDGEEAKPGERMARLEGRPEALLKAERIALNFLQRMSGIATMTARHVDAAAGTSIAVADTRKTLPGYRVLDKYAVRCGGGQNHRYNLSAGIMVKENHIRAAGSIEAAVQQIRAYAPHTLRVEVEVETLSQVGEALRSGAEIIMLDNMDNEMMAEAIREIRADQRGAAVVIEASGNMTLERLKTLQGLDLDVISFGALTHSVMAADISMLFEHSLS